MDGFEQPIDQIMTQPVRSVTPETPVRDVATIVLDESIGSVVVGKADGIVTKTDLVEGIDRGRLGAPARALMTSPVVTVSPEADVQIAIDRMDAFEIKRLVVEADTTVGVVSMTDIRRALGSDDGQPPNVFAGTAVTEGTNTYECVSCGERASAASKPGTCPACEAPMRNITMPRN
jgi:CBS domain-containing protein